MNLCIDIGNSRVKLALFEQTEVLPCEVWIGQHLDIKQLEVYWETYTIQNIMMSSVRHSNPKIEQWLIRQDVNYTKLSTDTPLPFKNHYTTPKTLGRDRIAAVAGARALYPEKGLLVVDAGTCITYDFLDAENNYFGGSILPGIQMRFRALQEFTAKLPLIHYGEVESFVGDSTETSIQTGVEWGVVHELRGFAAQYRAAYGDLSIIVTGGDGQHFENLLQNQIFAVPNLVLIGLNQILNYYVEQQGG